MNLTMGVLYDRLSKNMACINMKHETENILERPVFYTDKATIGNHVCIVKMSKYVENITEFEGKNVICIGKVAHGILGESNSLLIINDTVSIFDVFNEVQKIFDMYDEWQKDMEAIIYENKGISDLLDCSRDFIDNPISIVDSDFTYVAVNDEYAKIIQVKDKNAHDKVPYDAVNELIVNPEFAKAEKESDIFVYPYYMDLLCYNIKKEGNFAGRVIMSNELSKFDDTDRFVLRYIGICTQKIFDRLHGFYFSLSEFKRLRQLLEDCINLVPKSEKEIKKILDEIGWEVNDRYIILKLQFMMPNGTTLHAPYLCQELEKQWKGSCAVKYMNGIVWLINQSVCTESTSEEFYQKLAYVFREGLLKAGISRSFYNFSMVKAFFEQAKGALEIGQTKDEMFWYYRFENYALNYILKYGSSRIPVECLCSPEVLKLIKHDREVNTRYYETLRMYFEKQFNGAAAASALFIHRSTFINRMERIKEITQIDLDDWNTKLYIMLSFQMMD